jgi:teichuronic acid exporter
LRASPGRATRSELRRLVSFGGSVFVLRFAGTLYRQMDKVILGVALTPSAVGLYEIANKIHLMAATAQSMSVSALLPAAATWRRKPEVLRDIYLRGSCYTVAASLPVLVGAFAFAEPLVRDWIGSDADGAAAPARLFLAYLLINVVHNVGSVMVVALGRLRAMLIITLSNVLINLVVSVALVGPLGIEGVILGTLVGNGVVWPLYLRLYLRVFDVELGQWFRRIVLPNLPSLVVQGAVLAALVALTADSGSLLVIAMALGLSVAVYLATFIWFGLGAVERGVLLATLRSAVTGRAGPPAAQPGTTS